MNLPAKLVFALTLLQVASADLVVPSAIKTFHQGDTLTGNGSALRAIDGSGMAKGDPDDPSTWTINSTAWAGRLAGLPGPGNTEQYLGRSRSRFSHRKPRHDAPLECAGK